jgi:hypothetical protein
MDIGCAPMRGEKAIKVLVWSSLFRADRNGSSADAELRGFGLNNRKLNMGVACTYLGAPIGAGRNKEKGGSLPENQVLFVSGKEI